MCLQASENGVNGCCCCFFWLNIFFYMLGYMSVCVCVSVLVNVLFIDFSTWFFHVLPLLYWWLDWIKFSSIPFIWMLSLHGPWHGNEKERKHIETLAVNWLISCDFFTNCCSLLSHDSTLLTSTCIRMRFFTNIKPTAIKHLNGPSSIFDYIQFISFAYCYMLYRTNTAHCFHCLSRYIEFFFTNLNVRTWKI